MGKALKRWWPLFMLPTCLAFMIGFVIPFIQGFYLSFCQFIIISNAHFVGIENYVRALSDPQFSTSFFFTVAFAFLSTVLINVIALAIAQALTRKALKGTNIFRTIFFMPNLIGGIDELFFSCFAQGLVYVIQSGRYLYPTAITIYNHYAQLR